MRRCRAALILTAIDRPLRPVATARPSARAWLALTAGAIGLAWLPAIAADASSATVRDIEQLYRAGDTALAMERIDGAIALHPADPALRFLRAVMLGESHRDREAAEDYRALTRDFPELPEPFNNLAVLHAARGDVDGARTLLEEALRRDPDYPTAQQNLGDVLVRQAGRAYEAATHVPRPSTTLERKLRLVRSLDPGAAPPAR